MDSAIDGIAATFDAPVDSITPGQSAVFRREDAVLGGGMAAQVT
jgi:tRNA U34 2-thiouridine synthase MnmA/TrmU